MTTPRTAASSDARKRLAEAGAPSDWQPVELTDGERRFLAESTASLESKVERIVGLRMAGRSDLLTPPPVPRAPWEDLSTDRSKPTLARVKADFGNHGWNIVGEWWRGDGDLYAEGDLMCGLEHVVSVTLLDTYDPSTQVPVDRALIDRIFRELNTDSTEALDELAALADGAEKGAQS